MAASDLQVPMSLQQSHMPVLQEPGPLVLVTTDTTWTGCCWTTGTCMNCGCAIMSATEHDNESISSDPGPDHIQRHEPMSP